MSQSLSRFPKSLCFILGCVSALGFAPLGIWPLTLLALALMMHLAAQAPSLKSALARGYWFSVGHFAVGLNWIAGAFAFQDAMPVWLGWVAVVGLAFYLSLYPATAAGLAWRWGQQSRVQFTLYFAAAWIATEWLRATMFTGFAWNPLSVILTDVYPITHYAQQIGTYGLSGLVVILSGVVRQLAVPGARRDSVLLLLAIYLSSYTGLGVLALAILLAIAMKFGRSWPVLVLSAFYLTVATVVKLGMVDFKYVSASAPSTMVRIVQPNINQNDKHNRNLDELRFSKLEALMEPRSVPGGMASQLIVFPEDAVPGYLEEEEWVRERLAKLVSPYQFLITGGTALEYDKKGLLTGARNSLFIVNSKAEILGRYDKSHLVPGGEYLPLRWLMEPLGATRLVPGDIDFIPGPGPQTFELQSTPTSSKIKVGMQICYEIVFSGQVIDRNNRPDILINPSNDAWFGAWGPPQHLEQARMRAVEEGIPVVRSTPTGISAIIGLDGRVGARIEQGVAGMQDNTINISEAPTLFARYGNILPFLFALALTLIAVAQRPRLR